MSELDSVLVKLIQFLFFQHQEKLNMIGLYHQCDEGFDGFDAIFHTDDILKAADYIITEIKNYLNNRPNIHGKKFYNIIDRADVKIFLGEDIEDYKMFKVFWKEYFNNITPELFLDHLNSTYIDGDSYFQIVLTTIKSDIIITF